METMLIKDLKTILENAKKEGKKYLYVLDNDDKACALNEVCIGIIIVASIILNLDNPKKIRLNQGFWLMLLTAIMLSFESVFYKRMLQETDWISAAFWCSLLTFVIRWGVLLFKPLRQDVIQNFPKYKANFLKFCFIEIFDQLGNFGPIFALSILPVLVQISIGSTQPIFVIIYGFILAKLFGNKFK